MEKLTIIEVYEPNNIHKADEAGLLFWLPNNKIMSLKKKHTCNCEINSN
jgi:hypothetical protein